MKIPFIKTIFNVLKEVSSHLFSYAGKSRAFREVVLTPFPSPQSACLSFITGDIPEECAQKVANLVPVFVPTAPHPISGYLLMVPKDKVHKVNMTKEETVKLIVSCGMIVPEKPTPLPQEI